MKRIYVIKVSLFLVMGLTHALFASERSSSALNHLTSNKIFETAGISISVADAQSGKVVMSYAPNLSLTTASTLKLITTATALEMFGPDFRFETKVSTSGTLNVKGVLDGNVYITGSGDPTLGSAYSLHAKTSFFETVFNALINNGIREISGRIIGDESAYNTEIIPPKTPWEDMGNYYAAGVSALNYGDNCYQLTFKTGNEGTCPQIIGVNPSMPNLRFRNYLLAKANDKDSAFLYGMPFCNDRYLYGSVPAQKASFSIKGDVPDPALFLVEQLTIYLQNKGIKVSQLPTTSRILSIESHYNRESSTELCRFQSDPLSHIIKITNKRSNNFYAESLLRLIASRVSKDASLPAGIAALKSFWANRNLKTGFLMYDGSGLSPADRVNSSFFVQLMQYMATKSKNGETYFSSFAVAGVDGTLKSFLSDTPLSGKVRAKSGSFDGVISYCGIVEKNNRQLYFCIIINAFTGSATQVKRAIEEFLVCF